jgi:transposase
MESMARPSKYPEEFRQRAVRLVWEWREARGSTSGGVRPVAEQLGINHETLRNWVSQADVDAGTRPGMSSADKERIAQLEREIFELRRANEILKSAAVFFGAELDRRPKR